MHLMLLLLSLTFLKFALSCHFTSSNASSRFPCTWLSSSTRLFSRAGGQPSSGSAQAPSSLSSGWRTAVCCSRGCWDWPMSISNSFSSAPWLSGSRPRRRCHWTKCSRIFSVTTSSSMGPMGGTLAPPSEVSTGRSSARRHNIWSVWFLTAVRSSLEDEGSCCSNTQETWTNSVNLTF